MFGNQIYSLRHTELIHRLPQQISEDLRTCKWTGAKSDWKSDTDKVVENLAAEETKAELFHVFHCIMELKGVDIISIWHLLNWWLNW